MPKKGLKSNSSSGGGSATGGTGVNTKGSKVKDD
jgi:hypothetical protein